MNTEYLAVLIDADNANANIAEGLFREVAKYGIASTKRAYGDWGPERVGNITKWDECLLPFAITPIHQVAYTKQKNATDIAMVIDAMDLLYSGVFSGFCIVSSDSDFTPLASRIRENGLTVYGFGEKKTPEAFRKACDKFIYTENLIEQATQVTDIRMPIQRFSSESERQNKVKGDSKLIGTIREAIDAHSDSDGWATLSIIGSYVLRVLPDFNVKDYGFGKLSDLFQSVDLFETKRVDKHLKVRRKK